MGGATVVTWDINRIGNEETVELVRKEGYKAIPFTVDMSSREDIYRAAEKTKEEVGLVTILVNNAGIVSGSTLLETPDTSSTWQALPATAGPTNWWTTAAVSLPRWGWT